MLQVLLLLYIYILSLPILSLSQTSDSTSTDQEPEFSFNYSYEESETKELLNNIDEINKIEQMKNKIFNTTTLMDTNTLVDSSTESTSEYQGYEDTTDMESNYESIENIEQIDKIFVTTNALSPIPLYKLSPSKTFDFKNLKTKKIPKLLSSDGMLKNLDQSYWLLKFYNDPAILVYKYMELFIKDSTINIKFLDYQDEVVENNIYALTPIRMFKPNEGIFAYPDKKDGDISFIYIHLLLPNLLAMKMTSSFEEAEKMSEQSLIELGVFILR
ncbi:MAG: hypothetical protein KFW21_06055 [Spirochaetota bacterium]|nr:hypothetical protein [Spirochaetota bacterium]